MTTITTLFERRLYERIAHVASTGILEALNSRLNSQEIDYILKHSGARFLFVAAEL